MAVLTEAEARAAVVAEARTWIGTPYHHAASLKGVGVDCGQMPMAVYHAAGLVPKIEVDEYSQDWNLHRDEERYLNVVTRFAREVPGPTGPGDLVLYQWGRCYSHGAIIESWPRIIHALSYTGCVPSDADEGKLFNRPRKFFTLWGNP